MKIPPDALCAVEGCGHRYADHDYVNMNECAVCVINAKRGFDVRPSHKFVARVLAGGALNATQEREAYEKAMREA
ncbi:MAG: hypothetical protein ACYCUI_07200 [Vulcanimicrobiaceae bacterium]